MRARLVAGCSPTTCHPAADRFAVDMKPVVRFVRKWWWLLLLGIAIVATVLFKVLTGRKGSNVPITEIDIDPPKTLVDKARDKVEKVHLEGEIEKAKVRTVAEEKIKQIEAIEEKGKTEPKKAREDLAAFLAANL